MNRRCCHCGAKAGRGRRGLCLNCYLKADVRAKYPRRKNSQRKAADQENRETMAEVEALVARQMQHLPSWWHKSNPRPEGLDPDNPRGQHHKEPAEPYRPRMVYREGQRGRRILRKK